MRRTSDAASAAVRIVLKECIDCCHVLLYRQLAKSTKNACSSVLDVEQIGWLRQPYAGFGVPSEIAARHIFDGSYLIATH